MTSSLRQVAAALHFPADKFLLMSREQKLSWLKN